MSFSDSDSGIRHKAQSDWKGWGVGEWRVPVYMSSSKQRCVQGIFLFVVVEVEQRRAGVGGTKLGEGFLKKCGAKMVDRACLARGWRGGGREFVRRQVKERRNWERLRFVRGRRRRAFLGRRERVSNHCAHG